MEAIETVVARGEEKYGKDRFATTFGDRFASVLEHAHEQTGRRAVVLIDEYDKPLLDVMNTGLLHQSFRARQKLSKTITARY